MITAKRIEELTAKGYYVEDMGKAWGKSWEGAFRWVNDESGEFQDGEPSWGTADDAWAECDQCVREVEAQENAVVAAWVDAFMSESETL